MPYTLMYMEQVCAPTKSGKKGMISMLAKWYNENPFIVRRPEDKKSLPHVSSSVDPNYEKVQHPFSSPDVKHGREI